METFLGIANLILAMVIAIATWIIASRNRKVHIADKRHEWCIDFRKKIAEILIITREISELSPDNYSNSEYIELQRKVAIMTKEVLLMLDPADPNRKTFNDSWSIIFSALADKSDVSNGLIQVEHLDIIKLTDTILKAQREKIAKLDNKDPII